MRRVRARVHGKDGAAIVGAQTLANPFLRLAVRDGEDAGRILDPGSQIWNCERAPILIGRRRKNLAVHQEEGGCRSHCSAEKQFQTFCHERSSHCEPHAVTTDCSGIGPAALQRSIYLATRNNPESSPIKLLSYSSRFSHYAGEANRRSGGPVKVIFL